MKRLILVCLMILCLVPLGALAEEETAPALYPIRENGLWGYMNRAGEVVIEPQFATAEPFRGGYAVVLPVTLSDSRCTWRGIIDTHGDWVFPPDGSEIISQDSTSGYIGGYDDGVYIIYNPDSKAYGFFDIPSGFYSGQRYQWIDRNCAPDEELICVMCDNAKGFAERMTGEIVIPCRYELDFTYRFENGYCRVLPVDAEIADGWIVIDRQGTAIPMPENCYAAGPVSDGLVPIWDSETELCGYMDLSGNIVIEPQYDWVYPFSEGLACVVRDSDESYYAVITQDDQNVVILQDDALNRKGSSTAYSHGLLRAAHYDDDYNLLYILFLDHDGNEAFRLEIQDLLDVSDFNESGMAYYMIGEETEYGTYENVRYGFFNDRGEILTQPVFSIAAGNWISAFSEGMMPVTFHEYGKMGYINERGSIAYPIVPEFDRAEPFHNGLAMVEKNGKLGYVDYEGVVIWQEDNVQEIVPVFIGDEATSMQAVLHNGLVEDAYALIPLAQVLEALGYPLSWESETLATFDWDGERYVLDTAAAALYPEGKDPERWNFLEPAPGNAGHTVWTVNAGADFLIDSSFCRVVLMDMGYIDWVEPEDIRVRIVPLRPNQMQAD
ncbi:MAG: WG repeat-containing protein [Acidaminococcaceae bacterium]|nr:WG repeat-containing protein [Acidaminococcaceae bacterium]